ncbi:type II toxin-antitoxin system RelE/ParE family toxin [Candidatus Poribacteria bacterium]|nr:type II toxin-antitoxin system RelE/ParE family toxin [Candidatus Poribacteria bacterium]
MIKSFKCKETEKIYNRLFSQKLPQDIQKVALKKLWMLDATTALEDLKIPPSNHLESLRDDRKGQHSIRINQQWRICFKWHDGNSYNVEIVDYH